MKGRQNNCRSGTRWKFFAEFANSRRDWALLTTTTEPFEEFTDGMCIAFHKAQQQPRKRSQRGTAIDDPKLCGSLHSREQTYLAERDPSSFIAAVTQLYGPERARLSADPWLDESGLMDSPPRSERTEIGVRSRSQRRLE